MRAIVESSIAWNQIERHPKDSYRYQIGKASIEKESNTLFLELLLNFGVSEGDQERMKRLLKHEFPEVRHIDLTCTYREELSQQAEVIRLVKREETLIDSADWKRNRRSQSKEMPASGNRILGKKIIEEPISIDSIKPGDQQVTIEGSVFRKESRTIKNKKCLVTLLLTDHKESACVKLFCSEEKWNEIDLLIEEGDLIRVRGNVEYDNFEMAVVLKGQDLEKRERSFLTDTAEEKRIEFHAHTKMSAMDGLNDIGELLSTVAQWGHKAIAITDHGVVQAFPEAAKYVKKHKLDLQIVYGMEGYLLDDSDRAPDDPIEYRQKHTNHIILLAKNQIGLRNLYKLVSLSHLNYFYRRPRIPKSVLQANREGLLIGSACEAGEVFQAVLHNKPETELAAIVSLYDYLEIQPVINNRFLVDEGRVADAEGLRALNRRMVELGDAYGKPVIATCDTHYLRNEDSLYRRILMAGQGYKDAENGEGLYLRTTDEMLQEFAYLGEETAKRVVVEGPNNLAANIERVIPVPEGRFPPEIQDADEQLRTRSIETAKEMYGEPLPEIVEQRLERELHSIIDHGYAVMYVSAELLVRQSLKDGYLVGSRGSVGSSLAATMAGITEVNPLPPHYICTNPDCKHSEFPEGGDWDCGVDLPDANCPLCGSSYRKDGFNIPFEVFLGFDGDKEPDIDLNFAGEYQPTAHRFLEEIFGRENVFRAGTIGTVADRTAFGFVRKYFEEKEQSISKWEIERLTKSCTGVRRTTGQHPGGIIILPRGHEIYEFCPVQHPANDMETDIITTHFDYHSIDENLLKLDILGHDVPSMIRMLQDMTGVNPLEVPLKDPKVDSIFVGTDGLDIKLEGYRFRHGTYGIPEFGTKFVRQMLDDVKPARFSDLIRISGFSHGTDVWINNAQEFIRSGQATIKDAISTRDDIMNDLIAKGVPSKPAFKIMENVRKGKGVAEEEAKLMAEHQVPEWYIESCRRIQYMFPKAHAVAYVMMSYRIAYYKVYYPLAFYAAFFTLRIVDFNERVALGGPKAVLGRMEEIEAKGKAATKKEEDEMTVLEAIYEMYARGFEFLSVDLETSDGLQFYVREGRVQIPFLALNGVGETASRNIAEERNKHPFFSVDDLRLRAKLNKTAIEALKNSGVFDGIPESNQMSLF